MKSRIIFFLICFIFSSLGKLCFAGFKDITIEGWSVTKVEHGQKAYSLEADKATFGNKRVGFFNLAICKVIFLENGCFNLYAQGKLIRTQRFKNAVYELSTKRLLDENGNLVFCEEYPRQK